MAKITRLLWLAIFLSLSLLAAASLVFHWNAILTDWAVMRSGRLVSTWLPYPAFARYIFWWRALVGVLFIGCAGLVLFGVVWPRRAPALLGKLTILTLLGLPLISGLFGSADVWSLPEPWNEILYIVAQLVGSAGLVAWLLFMFLFPQGHFLGRKSAWSAAIMFGLLALALVGQFSGVALGQSQVLRLLIILLIYLFGLGTLGVRYRRAANAQERRQVGSFLVGAVLLLAMVLLLVAFQTISGSNPTAWLSLAYDLHLQLVLFAGLPLAIGYALITTRLWSFSLNGLRGVKLGLGILGGLVQVNLVVLGFSGLHSHPAAPQVSLPALDAGQSRPVLIDTDMGGDDWMAILTLLKRPELDVQAITVSGTGLTHCTPGVKNVLKLVKLAGKDAMPVACGSTKPLEGFRYYPQSWRSGSDSLPGDKDMSEAGNLAEGQEAVNLLVTKLHQSPEKVTILALGPLTNLAQALQTDPGIKEKITMVFIMGGAVDVPGNVGNFGDFEPNGLAEWNIYVDPLAAKIVFESGVPITLVALDVTNRAPVTQALYDSLPKDPTAPEAQFVLRVLQANQLSIDIGEYFFWDPLAAALLVDETLATYETRIVEVVTGEGPHGGQTRPAFGGFPVRLPVQVDMPRFEALFFGTLGLR
jgi:inosine-uridine nucleoside N-ribohydrolase